MKYNLSDALPFCFVVLLLATSSCSQRPATAEELAQDSVRVAEGRTLFNQNCAACHSADRDGIGPALGGITGEVSVAWITEFVRNPSRMIEGGDERAVRLHQEFKSLMPGYDFYGTTEINSLIAYLHTLAPGSDDRLVAAHGAAPLADPIPAGIPMSDLVVDLEPVVRMPYTSDQQNLRTRITKFYQRPDTREFFVLDLRGKLYRLVNGQAEVYFDMAAHKPDFINTPGHATGFGSFAFHPAFARNGLLYTTHTEAPGSAPADFAYADSLKVTVQWVLSEWKTDNPEAFPFQGTSRELLRINMVGQSHGVQETTFNPLASPGDEDYGLLYVGVGDGGSAERGILHINQGPENIWSSVIRIDPAGRNSANGQYGIPDGNPFVSSDNPRARGEVYAFGFRNPHKISWTQSGGMLVSNIGQHGIEELEWVRPGHHYGWPLREGRFEIRLTESRRNLYPLPPDDASFGITYSVCEYDHDEGNAIIGGYEYLGAAVPELRGKYLFGDMVNGRLFYVNVADISSDKPAPFQEWRIRVGGKLTTLKELCNDEARLSVRYGRDADGEIYISTMPDGQVYKVVAAAGGV